MLHPNPTFFVRNVKRSLFSSQLENAQNKKIKKDKMPNKRRE
jgi:hypothetical protein